MTDELIPGFGDPTRCVNADEHFAYRVVFDGLRFCGCGYFAANVAEVLAVLRACPLYEGRGWQPNQEHWGMLGAELLLHVMDAAGLLDHGTSVSGSWATDEGNRFLAVMDGKPDDWLDGAGYACSHCPDPLAADLPVGEG